jgi:hypothetical protein
MPLLEIRPTKKVTALCTLEESTATMVNQYAAFVQAKGDDVVNKALEYAFGQDKEFQKYRAANPSAPSALRVKFPVSTAKGNQRGGRQAAVVAAVR